MVFIEAEIKPSSSAVSYSTYYQQERSSTLNLWSDFGHVYKIPSWSQKQWHTCIERTGFMPPVTFCGVSTTAKNEGRMWWWTMLLLSWTKPQSRSKSQGWSSRTLVLIHLPNNTQDSEATARIVSAEAESSPVMCSGHKWRKAEKILVPDKVHFQTAASQEDFYKTKGWAGKKNSSGQFWLLCI